ncbi:MAG TPA: tyrosine decarboxylase MfnA [Candidatus Bathyarchaeia archaeon]|nr:tyrosine decarboxylase MfnA [Candidatus Bathyarchaeia archaeon]
MAKQRDSTDDKLIQELTKLLSDEKSYNNILSSMCTPPSNLSRAIASLFAEINLGDPGLFPTALKLEKEMLNELATMLHAPKGWSGSVTSGGSESNLIGCWASRNWAHKEKGIKNGSIILPKSAHVSFEKAVDLLNLEPKWIPLNEKKQIDIDKVQEEINNETVCIVGIAGTTGTGVCDDIKALSDIAIDNNIFLHVDAAHGGMILPFLEEIGYPKYDFDFSVEGVKSITIDTHKILGGLIPGGNILFRSMKYSKLIEKKISYLSDSSTTQINITGTRPGNSVLSSWILLKKYGRSYIIDRVKECMELTEYLVSKLKQMDAIKLAFEPTINIIGFTTGFMSTQELIESLSQYGWKLSFYSNWARIVVMPHFNKDNVDLFINNLGEILANRRN